MRIQVLDRTLRPVDVASYDEVQAISKKIAGKASKNPVAVTILSTAWTQETTSGHPFENGYYADATHGQSNARIACITAFLGASNEIHICDGTNEYQVIQSSTAVRIWLADEPQYNLLCLVCYA